MATIKEWFKVEEAAEYLSVSKRTIYKLTQEGRLPAFRIGHERHRRFRREDLDKVPQIMEETRGMEMLLRPVAESAAVLAELWDNEEDAAYDHIAHLQPGNLSGGSTRGKRTGHKDDK
jgi:excisionase family DNA binding protein